MLPSKWSEYTAGVNANAGTPLGPRVGAVGWAFRFPVPSFDLFPEGKFVCVMDDGSTCELACTTTDGLCSLDEPIPAGAVTIRGEVRWSNSTITTDDVEVSS